MDALGCLGCLGMGELKKERKKGFYQMNKQMNKQTNKTDGDGDGDGDEFSTTVYYSVLRVELGLGLRKVKVIIRAMAMAMAMIFFFEFSSNVRHSFIHLFIHSIIQFMNLNLYQLID